MTDLIDHNPPNELESSFGKFSRSRKAPQNTRVIAQTIYARLRDAILSAELRENKRLVEDELADWLKVSRTPIREALLLLEKEGMVERNRGWVVREHNPAEIQARLECRLAIEGYAARLAAQRRSDAELEEFIALTNAMEKPGIPRLEFNQINGHFHKSITDAAKNPTLASLHNQTRMNYWDLSVPIIFSPEIYQKFHEHHRSLIKAIATRDGDRAETLARMHIQLTMGIVLDALGVKDQAFTA